MLLLLLPGLCLLIVATSLFFFVVVVDGFGVVAAVVVVVAHMLLVACGLLLVRLLPFFVQSLLVARLFAASWSLLTYLLTVSRLLVCWWFVNQRLVIIGGCERVECCLLFVSLLIVRLFGVDCLLFGVDCLLSGVWRLLFACCC